jgi:RNA polymerase sigma-54 factor
MLKQSMQMKMLQKLSPQQIQLMKLLQIPTIALEQRIKEELETNPALEEGAEEVDFEDSMETYDDELGEELSEAEKEFDISEYMSDDEIPDYKLSANNQGKDSEEKVIPVSAGNTFHEMLETQLGLRPLSNKQQIIGKVIIGNIDESGYLRRDLYSISNDLAFMYNVNASEEEVEDVLKIIQDFEPAGVGARDLKECLLLQLHRKKKKPEIELAIEILENHFEAFTKKHYEKILKKLNIDKEALKAAIDEILKLNPKPGNSIGVSQKMISHIIPDFILTVEDGEISISLNSKNAPELRISKKYSEMLEAFSMQQNKPNKAQKEAIMFVKQKLDSAKWFIDAIKQRQETLMNVMEAIVEHQREYFITGDETKLKPMILKDIAEKVGMDISTISRVVNSKYVQTPYGTFLLKTFFSESLTTESGEEVSTREVKKILQDAIDNEDKSKPLTDEKLAKLLKEKGYNIARRTVAKYREQLGIPVARLRKEL